LGRKFDDLGRLRRQRLGEKGQGQALAGVAKSRRGVGAQLFREVPVERIGTPRARIGHHGLECGVEPETLKDQIPKGDDGGEEPRVESFLRVDQQLPELFARQEPDKESEQFRRGNGGAAWGDWCRKRNVEKRGCHVCIL